MESRAWGLHRCPRLAVAELSGSGAEAAAERDRHARPAQPDPIQTLPAFLQNPPTPH